MVIRMWFRILSLSMVDSNIFYMLFFAEEVRRLGSNVLQPQALFKMVCTAGEGFCKFLTCLLGFYEKAF